MTKSPMSHPWLQRDSDTYIHPSTHPLKAGHVKWFGLFEGSIVMGKDARAQELSPTREVQKLIPASHVSLCYDMQPSRKTGLCNVTLK